MLRERAEVGNIIERESVQESEPIDERRVVVMEPGPGSRYTKWGKLRASSENLFVEAQNKTPISWCSAGRGNRPSETRATR